MALTEDKLRLLGFDKLKQVDDDEASIEHVAKIGNVVIEVTNLSIVEITTRGNYIELPKIDNDKKLEQLINLLS